MSPAWLSDMTQGSVVTDYQSSQPGCSPGCGSGLSAARVLSSLGTVSVLKGFKAFKCTSANANTLLGTLTPLEPLNAAA